MAAPPPPIANPMRSPVRPVPPAAPIVPSPVLQEVIVQGPPTTEERLWQAASVAGMVFGVYHGTRRNDSVGWGLVWGLAGGFAPVVTTTLAVAQGFGQAHKNPTHSVEDYAAGIMGAR